MPANVVVQGLDNATSLAITQPFWSRMVELPSDLVGGMLYVQVMFDNILPAGQSILPELPITFGGTLMNRDGALTMNIELAQAHVSAYLPIGDGSDFDGELQIDFTNYLKVMPNASRVRAQWFVISGLEPDALQIEQLVFPNGSVLPLALSIDAGVEAFVLTSCGTGNGVPVLAAPAGYTNADAPTTNSLGMQTAWLLAASGAQDLSWTHPANFFGSRTVAYAFAIAPPPPIPCDESHNCECDTTEGARPLGELRLEMLRATGYAAQANRPPPGIVEMYNGFLDRAQKYIYSRYRSLQTERFFSWTLLQDVRYYGVANSGTCCDERLNRYRITGAWIEDLNGAWHPLVYGIDPRLYTMENVGAGWPQRYEVRQCIELFPAPQANYKLWIKGHFGLRPFWDDAHLTTIEAEAVLLHATGMAKRHKGMPDAEDYFKMGDAHVRALVAGSHGTRRYIPGAKDDVLYEAPPRPLVPSP